MQIKESSKKLVSPKALHDAIPCTNTLKQRIHQQRIEVHKVLDHQADRLLVVVGPFSIHDPASALDFAKKLKKAQDAFKVSMADKVGETLEVKRRDYAKTFVSTLPQAVEEDD